MAISEVNPHTMSELSEQATISVLEEKHKQGYAQHPVEKGEFSVWEFEQEWGDR